MGVDDRREVHGRRRAFNRRRQHRRLGLGAAEDSPQERGELGRQQDHEDQRREGRAGIRGARAQAARGLPKRRNDPVDQLHVQAPGTVLPPNRPMIRAGSARPQGGWNLEN